MISIIFTIYIIHAGYTRKYFNLFSIYIGNCNNIHYIIISFYFIDSDTSVKVLSSSGQEKNGKILGLDEYGFLKIRLDNNQIESVQPDGNSFDMLRGLIVPKAH